MLRNSLDNWEECGLLRAMAPTNDFTVHSERDLRTGKVWASCPKCSELVWAMTAFGIAEKMCDHMNDQHSCADSPRGDQ